MLPADTVRLVVEGLVSIKQKPAVVTEEIKGRVLSDVIKQYVAERESLAGLQNRRWNSLVYLGCWLTFWEILG
jgi:hypothetical protein